MAVAYTPTPAQAEAIALMAAEPTRAALNGSFVGVGKTLCSIELAKSIGAKTILVIAPLGTFDGWTDTANRQMPEMPVYQITPKTPANFDRLKNEEPGVYLVGREFFHLSATDTPDKEKDDGTVKPGRKARWSWKDVHPDLAVADEVQFAASRKSNGSKVLRTLKAGYKVAVSATPQGNKFEGLWAVTRWLWPDLIDKGFWRWSATWANEEYCPFAQRKITGEKNPGAFVNSLPCYVRIEREEVPQITRNVRLDMTPAQTLMYKQMEADALAWIKDNPLVAELPITKHIRLRQMALGEVSLTEDDEVHFSPDCASPKIDALHTIIEKHHPGKPILVFTDSAKFAKVVAARLGPKARHWTGEVSHDERDKIKAEFGESVQFIVATIPSIAEGIDGIQKVCNIEVWLSKTLNNVKNVQAAGRLNRTGQPEDVIYSYNLMMNNSDDDGTFSKLLQQTIDSRKTLTKEEPR